MHPSFTKFSLPNGLLVLLKEVHTVPLISHWIWYRVGSRNEQPGLTGISHWVEHMQFKGTDTFPAGVLDKAISRDGGYWNALTYLDWTAYFETLPAEHIQLALDLESDRMIHSHFTEKEVESERTVIISELEGGKNHPLSRLGDAVQAKSFDLHPYRNEVIGSEEDLRAITRDDLYQHYRRNYAPNNAILSIAGDFDTADMKARIEAAFGDIPPYQTPVTPIDQDAPIQGIRNVALKGASETAYLQVAYRAPQGGTRDFLVLLLLDSILTGPTSLNLFSAGITNKTSRLYQKLVLAHQAVSLRGSIAATIDPYLYDITVTLHPRSDHESVLRSIDTEIERLQTELVPAEELARAVKQQRAMLAYGNENITNQAFWMGYCEIFSTYEDWFLPLIDTLEEITPEDIRRVAQQYLSPDERVIGKFIPSGNGGAA
ncbi:MAG: pitrilysin family protein [Anaerolineae bacterium]|jgi:zinc protease|nr:pitrilysin family protein [Anaerolineae bacterium]